MRGVRLVLAISGVAISGWLAPARGQPDSFRSLDPAQELGLGVSSQLELEVPRVPTRAESYPALRGKVLVYNIFVGDSTGSWSVEDEAEVDRRLDTALAELRQRAREHHIPLDWVRDRAVVDLDREIPTDRERYLAWTGDAIAAATGDQTGAFVDRLRRDRDADHAIILLHIKPPGRSYCARAHRPARVVMMRRYLVDYSSRDSSGGTRIPLYENPTSYAHEILHAFGAEDLYEPDHRRAVAERLYPDDIMLNATSADEVVIRPCTSYRIGWSEPPAPETCP